MLMRKCIHLKPIAISCFRSLSFFLSCSLFTIYSSSKFQRHLPPSSVASAHFTFPLLLINLPSFSPSVLQSFNLHPSPTINILIHHYTTFRNPHKSCKQQFCSKHTDSNLNTSNTPPPSTSNLIRFVHRVIQDGCRGIMCKLRLKLPSGNFPLVSSWRQERRE